VTFVFTDIEGSTRLWEEHPVEMQGALARHDEILRSAIERHGGFVFSTAGDAFAAAFGRVGDALAAVGDAQQALSRAEWPSPEPLRVRMGVHTGEAQERDGDYFGPAVNRAARIMSVAHGGQVLASGVVAALAPDGFELRELGSYRLKDLMMPEQVSQVIVADTPTEFPPIRSRAATPGNVPVSISSFIGRERDTDEVRSLLTANRLVTIVGAPGAGKTRLAFELAGTMLGEHPDGVWCVELAPLRDGDLIAPEFLRVLELNAPINVAPVDALCDQVAERQVLLVVDNCEHLLAETARIVHRLLRSGPGVKVLATSRHPLGIGGEIAWPLPPLALPTGTDARNLDAYDGTRLFAERALAARPDIDLSAHGAAIGDLCRRLDGLPLALELAATRLRTMSLEDLAGRLDDRFRLLTHGDPTALEHHQTLRAVVDWSYELLDDEQQAVYRKLAVFRGGWTSRAAEVVCDANGDGGIAIADAIEALTANSLAVWDSSVSPPRFRMLETMREHGLSKLAEHGEVASTRDRHLAWLLALCTEAESELDGPDQSSWLARLDAEIDNLRSAYSWGLGDGDAASALGALARIPRYWWLTSQISEGAEWFDRLLEAAPSAPPSTRGRGLAGSGFLINMLGRSREAELQLRDGVKMLRQCDDEVALAWALNFLGRAGWDSEDPHALRDVLRESADLFAGNQIGSGLFISQLLEMGVVSFLLNDRDTALVMADEIVAMAERVGAPNALAHAYEAIAWADWQNEVPSRSLDAYRRALPHYRELGNRDCAAHCLSGVAHSLAVLGRTRDAAELMGAVDALLESLSVIPPSYERVLYRDASEVLGDAERIARQEGRSLDCHAAIDRALELIGDP
jgi:predicted ATPase/class 3 adenylate cyclase